VCELDKYVPVVPTTSKKCSLIDFLGSREFMQAAPKANDGLRLEFQSTMLSNPPPQRLTYIMSLVLKAHRIPIRI